MNDIVLRDYPKSSASYRVQIALNLSGLDYRVETVNLFSGVASTALNRSSTPKGTE